MTWPNGTHRGPVFLRQSAGKLRSGLASICAARKNESMGTQPQPRRRFLLGGLAVAAASSTALLRAGNTTPAASGNPAEPPASTRPYYLEIVAPDADAVCALYQSVYGLTFGEPEPGLGVARTARLGSGELIGIRAPMHGGEKPVTRPYFLVADIAAAVAAAAEGGAEIAVPPMEIPGHGQCAIFISHGIKSGLWQV